MNQSDVREKLSAFIAPRLRQKFEFGTFDCCILAADWAKELTGKDPMEGIRGTYSDELSAARVFADAGGLGALIEQRLLAVGAVEVPRAAPGDIVLGMSDGRECCGLWVGGCALAFTNKRLQPVPRENFRKAWRLNAS